MEVLRHLRSLRSLMRVGTWVALAVAAGSAGISTTAHAQRGRREAAPPPVLATWPVKTREHVDLWLHGYALLQDDTASIPIFTRDYRQRVTILKNSKRLYTPFDSAREDLAQRLARRGDLIGGQFIALYFGSWEEMTRAAQYFFNAEGDPTRNRNRDVQVLIALFAQYFPSEADREFLLRFINALEGERTQFYREWWVSEERARRPALIRVDSLWQHAWRPSLQRFLNHTQQQNGDLILSVSLGAEGRALPAGKTTNQYAITWPATADSAETMLFAFAHEVVGSTAQAAIADHLTPAETRAGLAERYASAGVVRGGAILVERVQPGLGVRYARWYLAQSGRAVPADDAEVQAAFAAAFPLRPEMLESMGRQITIAFGGI